MINNLLEIALGEDGKYYFSEFGECLIYALIGILIVFVGIAIIVGILYLVGFIMKKTTGLELFKKKEKVVKEPNAQATSSDEVPDEIKAAIVAALMAYYSQENPKCEFKVKRIKRI